ncbi:hypothetical protein [Streptomyces sp. WZ.A104]|uniref:hypothetical protein n=1 Tax=Streptomyces sp. WZ.A104 TaxID=2023771 RepID=UPI00211C8016|nr:hypothetical protein [Streptomyces sp. WZ.A104]
MGGPVGPVAPGWVGPAVPDWAVGPVGGAGGGGGDLRHSDAPWVRAAGSTDHLVTHLGPVKGELETAHQGLTAGAGALASLAELSSVRDSWERRLEAARGECGSLAGKLRAVARCQAEVNEVVRSGFDQVKTQSCGGAR